MSIKIVCDVCKKDTNPQDEFIFEAAIIEMVSNIIGGNIDVPKRQKKTVIHICKDCYDKKIKDIIYGKK